MSKKSTILNDKPALGYVKHRKLKLKCLKSLLCRLMHSFAMQHVVAKGQYRLMRWSIFKCKLREVVFMRFSSTIVSVTSY